MKGYKIKFTTVPHQHYRPKQPTFKENEAIALNKLLKELLLKGVIKKCTHEDGELISPVFLHHKRNWKYRLILNLKNLNKHVPHINFKMDTLQSCIILMKKNCFMGSLDLSDAYYPISIHPESQKYLKFRVGNQIYKFITLPN